jgi:hypothetical protein
MVPIQLQIQRERGIGIGIGIGTHTERECVWRRGTVRPAAWLELELEAAAAGLHLKRSGGHARA